MEEEEHLLSRNGKLKSHLIEILVFSFQTLSAVATTIFLPAILSEYRF